MVEIYKAVNHLNPPYMRGSFTKNVLEHNFRIKLLCKLPPARSQRFGPHSLKFEGSIFQNSLGDEIKTAQSLPYSNKKSNHGKALIQLVIFAN